VATPVGPVSPTPSLATVTRRVVLGQMFFTAGHALSSGGFLYYFANEFRPSAALFALLQVLPEIAETAGLFVRPLIRRVRSRKRVWMAGLVLGRVAALGIPAMAFGELRPPEIDPFWIIVACVGVWYACQGLSYVAYISWLSDLAPEQRWGRFFAARQVGMLTVTLVATNVVALARERWLRELPDDARDWSFVVIFIAGGVLALLSIVPLLSLPDVAARTAASVLPSWTMLRAALADRSYRLFVVHGWWLACAQGLSQAALYKYQVDVLHLPISTYYALTSLMLALQLPLSFVAGRLSDRYGDRGPLLLALFAISPALLFWMAATPTTWWLLFAAYALWGLFGIVNLCQQNLALRLAPAGDNTLHFALFRQIGGLLAGLAGLVGGLWLDSLLRESASVEIAGWAWGPFEIVFVVSLLGRVTAPLWLLGVREKSGEPKAESGVKNSGTKE